MTDSDSKQAWRADATEQPWSGYLFNQIAGRFRSLTQQALQPLGLSPPMLRALETIGADQPLTQVQLGNRVGMDRTTIVHVIDRFEKLGYARRSRSSVDRRAYTVLLTAEGETALAEARVLARDVDAVILSPLSPVQRQSLLTLLQAIHQPVNCPED